MITGPISGRLAWSSTRLSGERPFRGEFDQAVVYSILNEGPAPSSTPIPDDMADAVGKCLAKNPEDRYPNAAALLEDLRRAADDSAAAAPTAPTSIPPRRHWPLVAAVALLAVGGFWGYRRYSEWQVETRTLPRVAELADQQRYDEAFALLRQAQQRLGDHESLGPLFDRTGIPISITTEPPGADVYVRPYEDLEVEWEYVGRSPIEDYYVPRGRIEHWRSSRWRVEKEGFLTVESIDTHPPTAGREFVFPLPEAGNSTDCLIPESQDGSIPAFSIGCFEVTNAEYKSFVEAGGYAKPEYWEHPFESNGTFEGSMAVFRDATGQPGPATWRLGSYPEGLESNTRLPE